MTNQDKWSPVQDVNPVLSEQKAVVLSSLPRRHVPYQPSSLIQRHDVFQLTVLVYINIKIYNLFRHVSADTRSTHKVIFNCPR